MIYDIFTIFHEMDLLELRLKILNPRVDYFVIVEATETFMGKPKPLYFKENEARFAEWKDKIIYHVVDDFPNDKELYELSRSSPNVGAGEHYWVREFYQKESIKKALTHLQDDDICFVSDVDKVWNPDIELDFGEYKILRPKQLSYLYYLNNRTSAHDSMWTGTIAVKYKDIKNDCLNHLRTRSRTTFKEIPNGGWHFESLGGVEGAQRKFNLGLHPDYYQPINVARLTERVKENKDYKGRGIELWVDESDLPKYLLDHKEEYKHLFK